jgi:hypothetical protein
MSKSPLLNFPVRDLKLEAIARLAQEDWDLPHLRNTSLEEVAVSFRASIATVRFMMSLPTTIAGAMAHTQRAHDLAEFLVTGQLGGTVSPDNKKRSDARAIEILQETARQDLKRRESGDWDKYVLDYHLRGATALAGLTETPYGAYGFIPMFSGYITGTWTAIETMLGDLWEVALNAHPKKLAALNGKPRPLASGATKQPKMSGDQDKKFDLNLAAKYDFDLRTCMGTIFRFERRFEFTRLSGAREAYMRAFSEKSSKVDAAINSKSLDNLSAVRNVFLHKGGEADDEYVRLQTHLAIPKSSKGEKIKLNGQNTSDLIKPAITSSRSLMIAVDDWIHDN